MTGVHRAAFGLESVARAPYARRPPEPRLEGSRVPLTDGEPVELQAHRWVRPIGHPRHVAGLGGDPRSHLIRHVAKFLVNVLGGTALMVLAAPS